MLDFHLELDDLDHLRRKQIIFPEKFLQRQTFHKSLADAKWHHFKMFPKLPRNKIWNPQIWLIFHRCRFVEFFTALVLIIAHLIRPIDGISWRVFVDVFVVTIQIFLSRILKPLCSSLNFLFSYHRNNRGWNYFQQYCSEAHLLAAEQITQVSLSKSLRSFDERSLKLSSFRFGPETRKWIEYVRRTQALGPKEHY